MHEELHRLYQQDQADRGGRRIWMLTLMLPWLVWRDWRRRRRVARLLAAGAVAGAEDRYHAAMTFRPGAAGGAGAS